MRSRVARYRDRVKTPLYEQAGGSEKLRAVITDFYGRVFDDLMIGFFFEGRDRQRLIDRELELALSLLGADVEYGGRSIREAHSSHAIMGGHFQRRLKLLEDTMRDHRLPDVVQRAWLSHSESLRDQVTADAGGDCDPTEARRRSQDPEG